MCNPRERSEKLCLNWFNMTSCNGKRGKTCSNQFQWIVVWFQSKGNTLTILAGSERQWLIHLQVKSIWTTGLYFGDQKKVLKTIFYKTPRITSPKTTYKAMHAQWHPTNHPWAQHCPDSYRDRQERASAFLLAAVFPGQDHISTTVFHNKVRQIAPWQKCTLWIGG